MCGFLIQEKKSIYNKKDKKLFINASKKIFHRGPDSRNYLFLGKKMVFHSRLKIIDLRNKANQPFNRYVYSIIFNGEIYNFKTVKKELQNFFHFETNSDTEVLLLSYLKWKEKMFEKIEGMYSFVIINHISNELFFARDLFGQKPLFYFKDNNQVIFASEIKPILKILGQKKNQINEKEIYKYLNFNYFGDEKDTFFKSINQVQPGSYGFFKNNQLMIRKIKKKFYLKKNFKREIHKIILNEVNKHLISDVDIGILISDGVDSRSLLDLTYILTKKKLKMFNLTFESFDNSIFERIYNKFTRKDLIKTKFYKREFFSTLNSISKIYESPPLSLFSLGMHKMFKKIKRKKIKVVLTGQGVDEIFGGYNQLLNNQKKNEIYHPDGSKLVSNKDYYKKIIKVSNRAFVNERLNLAMRTKLPKNLDQLDKISMHHSVECRAPYLSDIFYQIIKKINLRDMYFKKNLKYLFRKSLFKITKDKLYFMPKSFKQSPQIEFLKDHKISKKIEKILNQRNYCDRFFNKKKVVSYYDEFKNNKNNGFIVWQYLTVNSFCESFKKL